jgi:hypothetical protein
MREIQFMKNVEIEKLYLASEIISIFWNYRVVRNVFCDRT